MKEITVDTNTLSNDISELETAWVNVKTQLNEMFECIEALNASWYGPAHDEFDRQFKNDHENAESVCETVRSLIDCMKYARDQYNACENEVNTIVSDIVI